PDFWFVPVIAADGKLVKVLNGEAFHRFILDRMATFQGTVSLEEARNQTHNRTVQDVLDYLQGQPQLKKLWELDVVASMDDSVGKANDLMDRQNVKMAIVLDENHMPTHYITTGDVRTVLLQS